MHLYISTNLYENINNTYNINVMDNVINVDYDYLQKTGRNLISLIPFIDEKRKQDIINKYSTFYT